MDAGEFGRTICKNGRQSMNKVLSVIASRRSVRRFKKEQIKDKELQAILESGLQAPSGHNDQSCYFVAVRSRELIDELSAGCKQNMQKLPVDWMAELGRNEKYHIFYNAPTVIIVAARKDAISPLPDACAAIENMLLAAESLGVGSCWMGFAAFYFSGPEQYRKLGIPEGYQVHYGVALGYKPEKLALNPPQRKQDKYFHVID
jgi:nitroreductase